MKADLFLPGHDPRVELWSPHQSAQSNGERLQRLVLYVNADECNVVRNMAADYRPPPSVSQAGRLMVRAYIDALRRQEEERNAAQ